MSVRRFLYALMALAIVLGVGLPAMADDLLSDSDVLTSGVQTSPINLTATPGQVQAMPVDLFISCKTQDHISGNVTVNLAAPGGSGSVVPSGGSLSAAAVTVLRPGSWPADGTTCANPAQVTAGARVTLQVGAPTAPGTYPYRARWVTSDPDVKGGAGGGEVTINLTVAPAAPVDSTPPVITKAVSGTQGSNGWHTSNVTVTWSVTDAQSAVVIDSGCGIANFVNETAGASASCQAHSAGGSASDSVALKIDKTGPTATLSPSGTLGQNGWYTSNVTLTATGQDAVSGGVTCTAPQTQTSETTGATFNATCTNAAGLSSATNSVTLKVDKTGPSANLAVTSGTAGSNGWYTDDVTVSTSGADAVSGGVVCSSAQTLTSDTSGTPVNGSCTNAAGLSSNAAQLTVKLDKSNPTANLSVTAGTLGTDGWYVDDVTVHASGADNVSDPTACAPLNQQQTTNTTGQLFTADCTNDAGRTEAATPLTIKRDATPPTVHLEVVSGTPGTNGWYTSAVTVRTVGADPTSGVNCSTDQVLDTETTSTVVTGYCTNGAGTRTDATPLTVKIDTTGPTAVAAVSAGTLGADGWYTSDVTVHTSGGDSISGPVTCDANQHQTTETTGRDFTGTCTNGAGLSTVSPAVRVKLDKTGPSASLTPSGTLGLNGWFTSDVTISTLGQDPISGGVNCTADQHQTSETPGATFGGSCTNAAGLSTSGAPLTIKLDKSGPAATLSVTGGTPGGSGWYTSNVTVHADGSDDLSGPVACSADQTLTTDTSGTDVNGSCTNKAGLSTDAAALTVKLDKSNPTANLSITEGTLGSNGWYLDDVAVHTSGADNVSDPTVCTDDQHQTEDTTGQVFNGECTNDAGRTEAASPITVKRDATPPTAHLVVSGTEGANGWYTSNVTVTVEGGDETSGATCSGGAVLTTETQGIEVTGSCTNGAGQETDADPVTIKIDKTAPTAALAVTAGTAGDNGWYTSDVTVATAGDDSVSGPVTCTANQQQTSETAGELFAGTCTNSAGLVGHAVGLTIKLDKTAPTTKLEVTAGSEGEHGWYTSNVTVHTGGVDAISGIASCTPDQSQTDETTGQTLTGTCTNNAGLTSGDELTVKLDKTGPSAAVSPAGTLGSNGWYTGDVTVTAGGADTISEPVTCDPPTTLSEDTAATTVTGSCTNDAGLVQAATPVTIKLDQSNPAAALSVSAGTLGANDWYTSDVTVHTSGADNVSDPTACTHDQYQTTDTTGHVYTGECTNDAGRTQAADPLTVKRDASPPTAHLQVISGTMGANGWYTSAVTVRTTGNDDQSEVTCTADLNLTTDTTGIQVTGSCTNAAGLTTPATPLNVKVDTTAPTAALTVTAGTVGDNGWYTSNVTVGTSGADSVSGPVVCTADQSLTSETTGTTLNGSCTNAAGLQTSAPPLTVKLDKTAPSAALAITGGTTGSNGWYVSDVTATTSGTDSISNPTSCTADQTLFGDTTGTILNGTCTNAAGLVGAAAPITVKLDKTAPVVVVTNLDPAYAVGSVPTPDCTTSDAASGVASQATPTVPVLVGVGAYSVSCNGAVDRAGNTGFATATLQSIYRWDGFLQPINNTAHQVDTATSIFKAGSTVPVKFQLKRANGTIITPGSAPIWLTPVKGSPTTASVDEAVYTVTATSGGTYRADGDQWIYNWNTKGMAAGFYYRIGVKLDDGQTHYVNIGLR